VNQLYGGGWWMGVINLSKHFSVFNHLHDPRDYQKYQESRKLKMVFVDKARSLKKSMDQR